MITTRPPGHTQLKLADPDHPTTLEGVLDRIVYSNEENGWCVIRVATGGRKEPATAVGNMLGVQPGENLRLTGRWTHDPKYGPQFRVESYVSVQPSTLAGIERYLCSGLVKGIGRVMAKRLVQHFGLDTLAVIDTDGERLAEVEGIGPVRSRRILEAWAEQRQIREVMVFLQGHGVSPTHAVKIFKKYGAQCIALVRENPYRLALDIFGIGFKTADRIAANLGIAKESPRRAEAGLLHALGELSDQGHVYAPRPELVKQAAEMLEVGTEIVEPAVDELARQDLLVLETLTGSALPGTDGDEAVYLKSLHISETRVASLIDEILRTPSAPVRVDVERALEWFEIKHGIELAPAQRQALRGTIAGKILLVTGGPGTGKTTIVNALVRILEKKRLRVLLCAPTGRAAKRLAETTGRAARTIHRLLEFSPRAMAFQRNRRNPLPADLVVVDEVSMVDIVLAGHLLSAIPPASRVVLVGDADQLPSVGPGNVLRDLIGSGAIDVVRLTEIFRQASRSLIVANAHRVNRGEFPMLRAAPEGAATGGTPPDGATPDGAAPEGATQDGAPPGGTAPSAPESGESASDIPDFFFIEREEPQRAVEMIKHLIAERIPRRFGAHPVDDIQVLTPMHRGTLGAANLNAELQALLTPPGPSLVRGGQVFRKDDKVMQIRNNYDLDVFNGDIGRVVHVSEENQQLVARIDDREVRYDRSNLDELVLSFACSIHKAQGSEYPVVVMPIHTQHYVMLQRNLLYTGITRGRRLVVVVGTKKAIAIGVKNAQVAARWTWLAERLRRTQPRAGEADTDRHLLG